MYLPNKRPDEMKRINTVELANAFIDEQAKLVKEQVGDKKVLLALSGGVDSSVVAALLIKAIGLRSCKSWINEKRRKWSCYWTFPK